MSLKGQKMEINGLQYINDVSHWIPVDEPQRVSEIITRYYACMNATS